MRARRNRQSVPAGICYVPQMFRYHGLAGFGNLQSRRSVLIRRPIGFQCSRRVVVRRPSVMNEMNKLTAAVVLVAGLMAPGAGVMGYSATRRETPPRRRQPR